MLPFLSSHPFHFLAIYLSSQLLLSDFMNFLAMRVAFFSLSFSLSFSLCTIFVHCFYGMSRDTIRCCQSSAFLSVAIDFTPLSFSLTFYRIEKLFQTDVYFTQPLLCCIIHILTTMEIRINSVGTDPIIKLLSVNSINEHCEAALRSAFQIVCYSS